MSRNNNTIRIHVKFNIDSADASDPNDVVQDEEEEVEEESICCIINPSNDLQTIYHDVSTQLGIRIRRLSLVVYDNGHHVTTSKILTSTALKQDDIFLAIVWNDDEVNGNNDGDARINKSIVTDNSHTSNSISSTLSSPNSLKGTSRIATNKNSDVTELAYPVGTYVRKYFGRHRWSNGKIVSIDAKKQVYEVRYRDGATCSCVFEGREIHTIVRQYKTRTLHDFGDDGDPSFDDDTDSDDSDDEDYDAKPSASKKRNKNGSRKAAQFRLHKPLTDDDDSADDPDDDSDDEDYNAKPRASKKRKRTASRKGAQFRLREPLITDDQRKKLDGVEFVMKDFETYLDEECGYSGKASIRNITRPVGKLLSGEGISYHNWPDGVIFHHGESICMSDDFFKLYQEAIEHESKHGKDKSHGNLVRIPLKKLIEYQKYYLEKAGNSSAEAIVID